MLRNWHNVIQMNRLLVFLFVLPGFTASSQVSFSDQTNLLQDTVYYGFFPAAIVDMNGDMLDDIVRINADSSINIEYQVPSSRFTEFKVNLSTAFVGEPWGMCVADIDKNGSNDVVFGGDKDGLKIFMTEGEGIITSFDTLASVPFFLQGVNLVDIDNDSWVDVYACNDDARNYTYKNDGTGTLVFDTTLIPVSQDRGNYSSVWTDFDNDNDLDLYISKCIIGSAYGDPRIVNLLYVNDGNDVYTEAAFQAGIGDSAQSWSADFADIDNDGDMDLYVGNHYRSSVMYLNNGDGTFSNVNDIVNLNLDSTAGNYQCMFRDFDNNGFVDLILAGKESALFWNFGNLTFSRDTSIWPDPVNVISFALGDLNSDGFSDIYGIYGSINPVLIADQILINNTNTNGFLDVLLTGTVSNINGIGARLELYGPWGVQLREVRSGESYGIMNSFRQHFGLGNISSADSLIIKWPSGLIQKRYNITRDQLIAITEGGDVSIEVQQSSSGNWVYPNPTSKELNIRVESVGSWSFKLYDLYGKVVKSGVNIRGDSQVLNISDLAAGNYSYQIIRKGFNTVHGNLVIE